MASEQSSSTRYLGCYPRVFLFCIIPLILVFAILTGIFILPGLFVASLGLGIYCLTAEEEWTDAAAEAATTTTQDDNIRKPTTTREELEKKLRPQEFLLGVCEICLSDYEQERQTISGSPNPKCTHVFHTDCILEWLETKQTCPCCRASYI